jgi:ABC-type transport system involved in multi-copper enzyme maturation permease subunit
MSSNGPHSAGWLQRRLGWSNSRESWLERLGIIIWLAAAYLLWRHGGSLSGPFQALLIGALVAALAVLLRRGWLRLFGPVFFYDAIRLARQRRQLWLRAGYAAALGLLLTWIYALWYYDFVRDRGNVPLKAMAQMADVYFEVFMVVQFLLVALITPSYVAGAIADEKERKTLEFLLATDLRNREIVFGKLASRVGGVGLFILAGLPVLSLIQFFGGVDPDRVLAGFAATLITLLSLAAISIFASVVTKRAREAIVLAYLFALTYFAGSFLILTLMEYPTIRDPIITLFGRTLTGVDLIYAGTIGNPAIGLMWLEEETRRGGGGSVLLFDLLRDYAIFHGIIIVLCIAFAVWRVRALALRQSYGAVPRARGRRWRERPEVGENPMVWKEVFVESGLRISLAGRLAVVLILLLSFAPLIIIVWNTFIDPSGWRYHGEWWSKEVWKEFARDLNMWVRIAGTVVACLLLLAVAVRGAGSIRGERDRQTFDSLLTTPLSANRILWGKWWGCLLGVRAGWTWLGMIWLTALGTEAVHLGALAGMVIALAVYASAFAWIGIWFSLICRSALRATMATILTCVFVGGGYFLAFGLCCTMPLAMATPGPLHEMALLKNVMCGLSPAVVISWLPFRTFEEKEFMFITNELPFTFFAIIGLFLWVGVSFFVSSRVVQRFRRQTNRVAYGPEMPEPPKELSRKRDASEDDGK